MKKNIEHLAKIHDFKITALRYDILGILYKTKQPLGAYQILEKLRKIRPTAEPPTVYRVLEFFENLQVIHRLSHNNSYLLCKTFTPHSHTSIIFTCSNCKQSDEFADEKLSHYLEELANNQGLSLSNQVLEIIGVCKACH